MINGFVRERARIAELQLKLDVVLGLGLLPGLGMGLSFQLDPRGVFTGGAPFGLLCLDALRCPVRYREQLVEPRCPVLLRGFILRARPWLRSGSEERVHIRDALWRPGVSGVAGGPVLAATGAIYGLGVCLELLPPSGRQLRFVFRLQLGFGVWLGMPAPT